MPWIVEKKPGPKSHECNPPEIEFSDHIQNDSIWQCNCGSFWLATERFFGRKYMKAISHKKAIKVAGFAIPLKPQVSKASTPNFKIG